MCSLRLWNVSLLLNSLFTQWQQNNTGTCFCDPRPHPSCKNNLNTWHVTNCPKNPMSPWTLFLVFFFFCVPQDNIALKQNFSLTKKPDEAKNNQWAQINSGAHIGSWGWMSCVLHEQIILLNHCFCAETEAQTGGNNRMNQDDDLSVFLLLIFLCLCLITC